jgi:hypothetical protein
MTDNAGKIVAKSRPLPFVKTAEAFTSAVNEPKNEKVVAPAAPSLVSSSAALVIGALAVVALGLVLILLGLHIRPKGVALLSPVQ